MNTIVTKIKSQASSKQNCPSDIRAAYPFFHEKRTKNAAGVPYMKKDGMPNPRYCATFMFPKLSADPSQCANYVFLWGLAVEAAKKMWPASVDGQGVWTWPTGALLDVKDGDVPYTSKPKPGQPLPSAEEIAKKNAWRKGYWIVEAENFLDPGPRIARAVAGQAFPEDIPAKVVNGVVLYKSGDWGRVNIHAYAYQNETFGVNFGFDGFCFTREGEPIGASGPQSAAQMFGGVVGQVGAAPAFPTQQAGASAPIPGFPATPAPALSPIPAAYPSSPPLAPMPPQMAPAGLPPIPGR